MTTAADKVTTEHPAGTKTIAEKRRALGRGLESLLPGGPRVVSGTAAPAESAESRPGGQVVTAGMGGSETRPHTIVPGGAERGVGIDLQAQAAQREDGGLVLQIPLDLIESNPYQTRSNVDDNYLEELAASIEANGVLQPITVRPGKDGRYLLIAGECRWRASRLAKKETIPALVRRVSDQVALELTIIENLQRQDLNCLDQARAFGRLTDEFQLTQEQIALHTGLERSSVGNYLRLLRLPDAVRELLRVGQLEFGQAKVLMAIKDADILTRVAQKAAAKELSVRELEAMVYEVNLPAAGGRQPGDPKYVDPNVRAAQRQLEESLGVRVKITDKNGKGKIVLEYRSLEDFDRVVELLGKKAS
jgi:ParB family transcriptional regulator, chromosome partitioning protein